MHRTPLTRRSVLAGGAALAALGPTGSLLAQSGSPSGSLTYGISMTDLPLTTGQPDRGAGGYQFTGLTLYDPLVAWELDVADRPGKMVPGLATSWESDPADRKNWIFRLREGVTFHDGSPFDADAVIWNFDKVLNKEAPHFDQRQAAQVRPRLPGVASYRKLDASTVQVTTKSVDSLFPYQMLWFLISSPAQYEKVGRDWAKFAFQPSGTGPYKLAGLTPRVRAEFVPNERYWNPKRMPKLARLTLACVPEDLARVNALLSGNVDLIELPAPDAVPRLKAAGMRVVGNDTPHVWNYHLSMVEGSPWRDLRLRRAANLAVDREGVVQLMGGLAAPALGQVQPSSPWFGKPSFQIRTDMDEARKLVEAAGYSVKNPLKTTFVIPTGGTGQMLSLPINEFIQQSWAEVGIQVAFRTVELEVAYTGWRQGASDPSLKDVSGGNIAYVTSDPFYAMLRFYDSRQISPNGVNWSHYRNAEVDALCDKIRNSLDTAEQDRLLARMHEIVVDDAVQVWVVHDTNPHALSPRVKGYTQAQHWFQDLTTLA
ncbi:ABC transporter substrate-binding protein [Methylobacterium gregans]|uniref:Heme-binding protein A n=1 Tax=Methylobacterium gregans TaxID=374424 RepID=A0AA37HST4_9HYPH|nr:ABC transporter substrate-binding protein [Methylobacterium gregans]MDQ0522695.1 peptide/nickel transport system substrate-binding protein [Methylobacterium gregans]GJD81175.1 Heme-binding protein A [Methylobacterium gregans]GLS56874.1 ABC transporter substrate-binding protein [Methylobacterium gregans]